LTQVFNRLRRAGAKGPMVLWGDSGFYNRKVTEACRKAGVNYSITVKMSKGVHKQIAAIAEKDWTPIPYWIGDGAGVAEIGYRPFSKRHPEVRLIVRRVQPTPAPSWPCWPPTTITPLSAIAKAAPSSSKPTAAATPSSKM
jgi:hypothetical protein